MANDRPFYFAFKGVIRLEQNERIATLEAHLESLDKGISRIEAKLDNFSVNFVTRSEADLRFQAIEKHVDEMKDNKKANNALIVSYLAIGVTFIFNLLNYLNK